MRIFKRAEDDEDDEEVQRALAREDLPLRKAFGFVVRRLLRHPWLVAFSLLLGIGIAFTEVVSLGLILPLLESIGGGSLSGQTKLGFLSPYFKGLDTATKIRLIAVGMVVIQVFKGGLKYLAGRVASYMKILVDRDLRAEVFDQVLEVDLRYIHKERTANLQTILDSYPGDVAKVAKELVDGVPKIASFSGYLVALILLSWQLTLVSLVLAALTTFTITRLIKLVRNFARRINVHRVRLKHVSLESLTGIKLIHLFAREDYARQRYRNQLRTLQRNKYKQGSLSSALAPLQNTLMTAMFGSILFVGTYVLDTSAESWVLLLTMFMVVMFRIMVPATSYTRARTKVAASLPSLEQIMDFLSREGKTYLPDGNRPCASLRDAVRFEKVSFRYQRDEPLVLKDVSFTIPRGRRVALVGASGAGKSTIVDLLARLYDPTSGSITMDGADLRTFQVRTWRSRLAVVSQATHLFNGTVRENIRFGRLDAPDEEVEEAARQANAHEFVMELPDGYDTPLGERGVRLSGGQAQRIAIARAVLADPEVLILDEATSALDVETERKVQEALERVSRDRTVLAIAHRLATIRSSDEIIVLEGGQVMERGSHDELLARRGHYWRYVMMQDLMQDADATDAVLAEADLAVARVVLEPGGRVGLVKVGKETLAKARVVTLSNGSSPAAVLDAEVGDVVVIQPATDTAVARVGTATHEGLPIYFEGANGEGEVRVRVKVVRKREP